MKWTRGSGSASPSSGRPIERIAGTTRSDRQAVELDVLKGASRREEDRHQAFIEGLLESAIREFEKAHGGKGRRLNVERLGRVLQVNAEAAQLLRTLRATRRVTREDKTAAIKARDDRLRRLCPGMSLDSIRKSTTRSARTFLDGMIAAAVVCQTKYPEYAAYFHPLEETFQALRSARRLGMFAVDAGRSRKTIGTIAVRDVLLRLLVRELRPAKPGTLT